MIRYSYFLNVSKNKKAPEASLRNLDFMEVCLQFQTADPLKYKRRAAFSTHVCYFFITVALPSVTTLPSQSWPGAVPWHAAMLQKYEHRWR